jgi:hypothetical protein
MHNKSTMLVSTAFMACAITGSAFAQPDSKRIRQLEEKLDTLEQRLEATADAVEQAREVEPEEDRVSVSGYGSVRYELNTLDEQQDTFTFRRFVLAVDAPVTDRLATYLELEFERFAELELEKEVSAGPEGAEVVQAVEGTDQSEIAIEQAWARYAVSPALNVSAGAVLIPLGRFNLHHDDNQWNLNRRPLVDRGVPVLPVAAAWPELGVGLLGAVPVGERGLLDYWLYVVNGAELDFELEEEVEAADEVEGILEAEFAPTQGTFAEDLNDNKALTGRVAFRPALDHEIALSGYWGRYTPEFLNDESVWSLGVDGLHYLGGFELEYEAVYTRFEGVRDVAEGFAATALNQEGEGAEITLVDDSLADSRGGYWIELRYPFWPQALNGTFLSWNFANPQLEPTLRLEQVFFNDQLRGFEFEDGRVIEFETIDATLNRATLGLAYRPVPQWVVTVAGEYTWTNQDSLAGLTNFLAAQPDEDDVFAFTTGVAFGF